MELSVIEYSILLECSDFLFESQGIPLYKTIKNINSSQDKIKIRLKNKKEGYFHHLDNTLNYKNFKNRSLITNTDKPDSNDTYYIFLPDGYKCIHTKDNLTINLKETFENVSQNFDLIDSTFEKLLSYSYDFDNLADAIHINDEIIFYNIPYYYCISANKPYEEVLKFYGNIQN